MIKDIFANACLKWLNVPYKWGGDDAIKGADCSGLIQEFYMMIGLDPVGDQTAQAYYDYFKKVSEVDRVPLMQRGYKLGSLCFYGSSATDISHIAMIIVDMSMTMIEAGGGGSKTTTIEKAVEQNAFVRIRPADRRKDLVAIMTPRELPW